MQTTSALHKSIFVDFGTCQMEYKAVINGVEYGKDDIEAISTPVELYPASGSAIGRCVAREIDLTIWAKSGVTIPRAAEIKVYVRLVQMGGSGSVVAAAEWLPKGVYYIDTRGPDTFGETIALHGYDVLYARARTKFQQDGNTGEWPRTMQAVVAEIATRLGVEVDTRTELNSSYLCEYPNDLTMWEVLAYIAAAHGGNWMTTDTGALRLVPYGLGESVADIGQEMIDWSSQPSFDPYSRVTVWWDDEHAYTAGDDTGRTLEVDCPWATQAMADNLLAALGGYAYQPYEATEAVVDPAVEVGDTITANGITSVIGSCDLQYDALQMSTISAPGDRGEDHELGDYQGSTSRELARKVTLGAYYYGASITREKGLLIQKTDGETVAGEAEFNSDRLAMRALVDGELKDCIYFDTAAGKYRISGDVLIEGAVQSDASITDSLYAEQGDISQLTVDRLETSDKIRRYLSLDQTSLQFIRIEGLALQFILGHVVLRGDVPATEQLVNRYGSPLFWKKNIAGAVISGGYPYVDEERVYTTEEDTGFPVTVYQYDEAVIRQIVFQQDLTTGYYFCTETFGQGSGTSELTGKTNNQGFMQKSDTSFFMKYRTSNGQEIGIQMNNDGYTDLLGLRKTTDLDFSGWDAGHFTERIDGRSEEYGYQVEFDSEGRPITIRDSDSHQVNIKW